MPLVRPPAQAAATAPSSTSTPPTAAFAECTRKTFQAGQKDWYQIHAPTHFSNFDICPDCHKTSIAPTQYARFTSLSPPKSEEISTRCDFSDLWIRIAYAWLVTQRYPDLTLLGQVADIQAPEGTCPNLDLECEEVLKGGKKAETRTWYCFTDPKTNTQIEDLTVCSDCVAHIELIFPNLRGILTPACGGRKVLATCDLMSLGDAKQRCLNYLDQLIQVAETTIQKGSRDITPLTDYIKKWAPVPVCRGSENVTGVNCYEMPSVLPDAGWTICEECYQTHAAPLLTSNHRPAILSYIQPTKSPLPNGFICDLYSPRMQQYFTSAATTNDLSDFKRKIEARSQKYTEMQMQLQRLRMQHAQQRTQADAYMQMGRMAQQTAMTASMARTIAGGWGLPNFDASQAQMQNAMQMAMQADSTAANIKQVEKEWADFWE